MVTNNFFNPKATAYFGANVKSALLSPYTNYKVDDLNVNESVGV
jgi:hypothetical protein